MKKLIEGVLTILVIISIIKVCSELPRSPLGDKITDGIEKYRKQMEKKCEKIIHEFFETDKEK